MQIGQDGLDPERYGFARIAAIRNGRASERRVELDSLLRQAFLTLAMDARFGRPEARAADGDNLTSAAAESAALAELRKRVLAAFADPTQSIEKLIESLFPQHAQYHKMKQALATYRAIDEGGGWPTIAFGPVLKPGAFDARIPLLAERLRISDDLRSGMPAEQRYTDDIVGAVRAFQRRHGLEPDGVVGNQTIEVMNVPVGERIRELMINLERWRWLDRSLGERFVIVNLAGFELVFVRQEADKGVVLFRSPVIVGKPYLSTPVFSSRIQYVELNPFWNVPKSIQENEIEPKMRSNPGYLASQHMELLDDGGWIHIRQFPGPWNSLGAVKFVFPNPYDVYVHDTPTKLLFKERTRAFSHGCIRVKDPLLLAEQLLGGDSAGWSVERLSELVREGKNIRVPLSQPIPIHVVYRTAWVDLDGSINFRNDVYGRDKRMIDTLFNTH